MIGWLVAFVLYLIGCVWMLRTIYECRAFPTGEQSSSRMRFFSLWPAFCWPVYVALGESCMWLAKGDDDEP